MRSSSGWTLARRKNRGAGSRGTQGCVGVGAPPLRYACESSRLLQAAAQGSRERTLGAGEGTDGDRGSATMTARGGGGRGEKRGRRRVLAFGVEREERGDRWGSGRGERESGCGSLSGGARGEMERKGNGLGLALGLVGRWA